MKATERFDRAINALVKGYFNNTLAKGTCAACAVGNIVAAGIGTSPCLSAWSPTWQNGNQTEWDWVFVTEGKEQRVTPEKYEGAAKVEIDSTGYSWQDLARVEYAFETSTSIDFRKYHLFGPEKIDADQYRGLMAVVDVLCEIEGIGDPSEYKAMFAQPTHA